MQPILGAAGYECIEVEWVPSERSLRIFIDFVDSDQSIVMDDCLAATALLTEQDELDNLFSSPYRLEVSSPGIERPLRTLEHFRKVLGQEIQLVLTEKVDGRKKGQGKLESITDAGSLLIDLDSNKWSCPIDLLNRANLVYDWS